MQDLYKLPEATTGTRLPKRRELPGRARAVLLTGLVAFESVRFARERDELKHSHQE